MGRPESAKLTSSAWHREVNRVRLTEKGRSRNDVGPHVYSSETDQLTRKIYLDGLLRERFRALLELPDDESMTGDAFPLNRATLDFLGNLVGGEVEKPGGEASLEWHLPNPEDPFQDLHLP